MAATDQRNKAILLIAIMAMLAVMFAGTGAAQYLISPMIPSGVDLKVSFMSQDPDPAGPGETLELRWKIENNGSTKAEDVIFEIQPEFPFSLEPTASARKNIGSLNARQSDDNAVTLYYRLQVAPDALPGDEEISLRYSYDGGSTWMTVDPFDVRIASHTTTLSVESITVTPERLKPGERAIIVMTLKNNADEVLKDIKVKLNFISIVEGGTTLQYTELPFAPVGSSNEMAVAQISPGKTADVTFAIVVSGDANSEVYKVPLLITYLDKAENEYSTDETTNFLGLVVDSEPEYKLALKDTEVYTASSTGDVVLSLSNVGSSEIKYLSMELLDGEHYDVISPPMTYVGNLESDDFETAEYTLNVDRKAKAVVPLAIRLTYKDSYNKAFEKTETVSLPLYTKSRAKSLGLVAGGSSKFTTLIILAVLGGAGYWFFKLRKRKKR